MGAMEWKKLSVDELCPAAYNPRKKLKAGDKEYEKIKRAQDGAFIGIGITIVQRSEDQKLQVIDCMEDSPAAKAGVKAGDVIESINGTNAEGMTSSQAVELIQKSEDTAITMVLTREGLSLIHI